MNTLKTLWICGGIAFWYGATRSTPEINTWEVQGKHFDTWAAAVRYAKERARHQPIRGRFAGAVDFTYIVIRENDKRVGVVKDGFLIIDETEEEKNANSY